MNTHTLISKLPVYSCILIGLLIVGCSSSKEKKTESSKQTSFVSADSAAVVIAAALTDSSDISDLTKISGMLNYSGSEPFAWPTIFISDTLSYKLMADKEFIKNTYSSLSGNKATLYGKIANKGAFSVFEVYFYDIKTKETK